MKRRVSIKDIAQQIGVSTALVSYVLNNKEKEARVGKEIAEVIRLTAKKLNYQPNQLAKSLKSGRSYTIGLIVADISNPFFANLARTVEDEAQRHNYTVIFASSDESADKSWKLINVLMERQVDGFIITPTDHSEKQIEYLLEQQIPFVLVDRYFPGLSTNYVVTDNYQASYNAVSHLLDTGYRSIGLLVYDTELVHMLERRRGYIDALKTAGVAAPDALIREINFKNMKEDIKRGIDGLLHCQPKVDALFFASNTLALHGLKYVHQNHYRIPDDLGVVCFDEGDAFDFFYAPLTYINQPLEEVGKEAVKILVEDITKNIKSPKHMIISSTLVIRQSSGVT